MTELTFHAGSCRYSTIGVIIELEPRSLCPWSFSKEIGASGMNINLSSRASDSIRQ